MIRRNFLKRMALAAAACAFIDVPWPKDARGLTGLRADVMTHRVRNVVEVLYHDGDLLRSVAATHAESVARYGRRYVTVDGGTMSNTEAHQLADAILADLAR